jgi:hypothetical protein
MQISRCGDGDGMHYVLTTSSYLIAPSAPALSLFVVENSGSTPFIDLLECMSIIELVELDRQADEQNDDQLGEQEKHACKPDSKKQVRSKKQRKALGRARARAHAKTESSFKKR